MEQAQMDDTANQFAPSSLRVADIIVETLKSFGVRYVFGIPGTQVNPIVDALRRRSSLSSKDGEEGFPRFILVRDEGAAAIMATIVSRLTGKLGACLGMGAPGAVKLINGLYNAKLDGTPVIAISGQVKTPYMGLEYTQEIDLQSLFNPVSVYNQLLLSPANCGLLVSTACKHALELGGVAHLCVPEDIQEMEVLAKDQREMKKPGPTAEHRQVPDLDRLSEAARTLNSVPKVVIVAGRGASGCGASIGSLAQKLQAPVFTTFPGRDALRADHPNNMGIAWIFSPRSADIIQKADVVLLLGTDYPYMPEVLSPDSRVIQIDANSRNLGKRIGVDVPLLSSVDEALKRLVNLIEEKGRGVEYLDFARDYMAEMFDMLERKRKDNPTPINPYRLVSAIESTINDDAIITTDAGAVELYFSSGFKFTNHKFVVHGRYSALGFGVPAAIAAQLVYPKRQTIAVEGDLGFMTCLAELMTAMENSLPIKVIVFNNRGQAAIKFEQLAQGLEEFATRFNNDFNFGKFAEACGAYGRRVEDPAELDSSLEDILSKRGPAVLDVITSSEQLPIS